MEYEGARRLQVLMETHKLTRQEVADKLCNGSIHTVNSWLRKDRFRRNIPPYKLQLLYLLMEKKTQEQGNEK